jgi:hypothetical protein
MDQKTWGSFVAGNAGQVEQGAADAFDARKAAMLAKYDELIVDLEARLNCS